MINEGHSGNAMFDKAEKLYAELSVSMMAFRRRDIGRDERRGNLEIVHRQDDRQLTVPQLLLAENLEHRAEVDVRRGDFVAEVKHPCQAGAFSLRGRKSREEVE